MLIVIYEDLYHNKYFCFFYLISNCVEIFSFQTAGMWSEALRVCREYLPSQEAALRRELGQRSAGLDGANALEEARKWLNLGEVRPALDTLILNPQAPRSYLIRAADILLHQADPETVAEIGGDLGERLFSVGEHALAAQVVFFLLTTIQLFIKEMRLIGTSY